VSITIQVLNMSNYDNSTLDKVLNAVRLQLTEDVPLYWLGIDTETKLCRINRKEEFTLDDWQFFVADTPRQVSRGAPDASGEHEIVGGVPMGFAFVEMTLNAGLQPSVTISHEVLEMIGDAFLNRCNQWSDIPDAVFLAQEICDPVAGEDNGYLKGDNILVSDFVTPMYFVPGSFGPWDFKRKLSGPNTLAVGGFQLRWDPTNGWQQRTYRDENSGRAAHPTRYSRRNRRVAVGGARSSMARVISPPPPPPPPGWPFV
jgi:hypothetical protein